MVNSRIIDLIPSSPPAARRDRSSRLPPAPYATATSIPVVPATQQSWNPTNPTNHTNKKHIRSHDSVLHWNLLRPVDHDDFNRHLLRLKRQTELIPEGIADDLGHV